MKFDLPEDVKTILKKFEESGFKIYIVGGAVRDLLMEKEIADWDFTTDATPEEILKILPDGFYDNKFGTVGLNVGPQIYELTTMRKEGDYRDFRHPVKVSWTNKIEEDLKRRDFTINAIGLGLESRIKNQGKQTTTPPIIYDSNPLILIDPFNGQQDLKNKLIRAVGDADSRFKEDALRLIRAIRFASQLNFEIEQNTFQAISKNRDLIKNIAWERIRDELFKILASPNPYIWIVKLRETGILAIILPELERCFGIQQMGPKHDRTYDIGEHSLLSLKNCPSTDSLVRFASLLHDIGKPDTYQVTDGNATFYGHDVVGGNLSKKIAQRLGLSKKQTDKLYNLIRWHMFTVDEKQTDSAIRRFIRNVGVDNVDDMIDLRIGDRLGGGTQKAVSWRMQEFRKRVSQVLEKPFSLSDLKVNGKDVMAVLKIKPSPKVGEVLEKLFQEVLEDSSKNNRDYLLSRIRQLMT